MAFADELAKRAQQAFFWVDIEGLRYRYGTLKAGVDTVGLDSWNPADSGTNRHIKPMLAEPPRIGGQTVDPLDGDCSIPSHEFKLFDDDDDITELICVSDTPYAQSYLTMEMTDLQTFIPVEDYSDFAGTGTVYLDAETITYSGKATDSASDSAAWRFTGLAPTGAGDLFHLYDGTASLGVTDDNYWVGARILFADAGGDNNGLERIVTSSYTVGANTFLSWDSPVAVNTGGVGETYSITMPPTHMKCDSLAGSNDDWNGAVVEFTSGICNGVRAYVQDFADTNDIIEFVGALPHAPGNGDTFSITLYKLTGCTRGQYNSTAKAHLLEDEYKGVNKKMVTTKVPFLRTRQVKIYESRIGLTEAQANLSAIGYITDYVLDNDMTCYTLSVSGLSKLLSKKILTKQKKGRIVFEPVWGGLLKSWEIDVVNSEPSSAQFITTTYYWTLRMEDDTVAGFTFRDICVGLGSDLPIYHAHIWNEGSNVKIDNEIIHYVSRDFAHFMGNDRDTYVESTLRLTTETINSSVPANEEQVNEQSIISKCCYPCRSLFSEKIGDANFAAAKKTSGVYLTNSNNANRNEKQRPPIGYPSVKALIEEHNIGADILQAMVCSGDNYSDFPRYDVLAYTPVAGTFTVGEYVTLGTSGIHATLIAVDATNGEMTLIYARNHEVVYTVGETITGGSSSATGTVGNSFTIEVRPRNNILDVWLQILCSTGTPGTNGKYDTLPENFGMGISTSFIDITGIESLRQKYFSNCTIDFVLSEPTSTKEWFADNVFKPLQIFPFETYDGKISLGTLQTLQEATDLDTGSLVEFNASTISSAGLVGWTAGGPPIGKVKFKFNKNPATDDFYGECNLVFESATDWYQGHGEELEFELESFYYPSTNLGYLSHNNDLLPMFLRRFTNIFFDRWAKYPCPIINMQTPWINLTTNIGDIVKVTLTYVPNMRTSARGLSSEYFQVLGKEYALDGSAINWTLYQVGVWDNKYARRCPSAVVSAYAANTPIAGKSRITLVANTYSLTGTKDISYFAVGQEVMFLEADYESTASPPPRGTIETIDTTNRYLYLDANITGCAAGWICEWADFDNATSTQQDTRTYIADDDRLIGTANESAFKLR